MTQTAVTQFNQDQLALVRQTVAKGTTPEQFKLFIEVCKYHGLNPFARQIYAVVRGPQMTIQTSIDGYRLLAERSGKYAGQIGPEWCGPDGEWKDVWLKDEPPTAARIGVLRKDFQQPTWGVAKYKSYVQSSSPLWQKMPDTMLAKCAESLALRKAFPAEMSGIYTAEEMQQADSHELPTVAPLHPTTVEADPPAEQSNTPTPEQRQAKATEQQITSIQKLCQHVSMSVPENLVEMPYFEAKELIAQLTAEYRKQRAETQQPAQPVPAKRPTQAAQSDVPLKDPRLEMIARAKKRFDNLPGDLLWEDIKREAKISQIKDDDLAVPQVVEINKIIAKYEAKVAARPKAS